MNFTQMLLAASFPPPPKPKQATPTRLRNMAAANKAKHEKAVARYRAAMGSEWVRTPVIEARMGVCRTACYETLMTYLKLGLLKRRPVGEVYCKNKGHEWRFK